MCPNDKEKRLLAVPHVLCLISSDTCSAVDYLKVKHLGILVSLSPSKRTQSNLYKFCTMENCHHH